MQKYEFYSITATLLTGILMDCLAKRQKKKPASLIHVEMDWLAGFHLNNILFCFISFLLQREL